ncbi:MAG TPA: Flp pilus assembly protein CpaB [Bryobacteraceae bacterium]|nr:Flp pilus assembly protein CpaB [Bryobacteraceae bacterium]
MDRQRILLLFGAALISATLLTWFLYAKTKAPKALATIPVVAAVHDLPLGTLLRKTDLRLIPVLDKDVPKGAISQTAQAVNRVLLYPVVANEPLTLAKLSAPNTTEGISSTIEPGYRAVSIPITDASGVAGLIQPNSRVDVLFTRTGKMADALTTTILQNVKVISIGRITQVGQTVDPRAPKMPVATLMVMPQDAQKLELAKSQGRVSLSLRNPLDQSVTPDNNPVTADALDPTGAFPRRQRVAGRANLDPKVWEDLADDKKPAKKEPEKPRAVVDVFHGDKHVQELFR